MKSKFHTVNREFDKHMEVGSVHAPPSSLSLLPSLPPSIFTHTPLTHTCIDLIQDLTAMKDSS